MMNTSNEFFATRNMIRDVVSVEKPLSYESWLAIADEYKAAALYLIFFDQILLAWYRLRTPAAIEEECVSEVLLYLNKNVDKIREDKKRFTPAYIYRVCYNCIYCKSVDPYSGQTSKTSWFNNTCSNIVHVGEDVLDLFDTIVVEADIIEERIKAANRDLFWKLIEDSDKDTATVINEILENKKPSKRLSPDKRAAIMEGLRKKFAGFENAAF